LYGNSQFAISNRKEKVTWGYLDSDLYIWIHGHPEYRSLKEMGQVLISFKIFPTDIMDLNKLKQKIERQLPNFAKIHKTAEEPIAYGLKALIAQILIPENQEGALDQLEQAMQVIPEISQIQTIMVSKT